MLLHEGDEVQAGARRPGGRAPLALAWLRRRLTTTPGRLGLASAAVVVGVLMFGTVAFTAENSRHRAAQAAAHETEPQLVAAVDLYTSLSDADATATTTFLTGGLEPAGRRARYNDDLRRAGAALTGLSRQVGTAAGAGRAVAAITEALPTYTGLVEAARADNRQRLVLGAAYMRAASELLATTILPAADRLYAAQATRLGDDYRAGTATGTLVTFLLAGLAALTLLVLAQRYLARITRRILSVPLLAATAVLAVLSLWGLIGLWGEQSALARAQREGSDSVEVLSAARILASRAQSDESLALVSRGGDAQPLADYQAVMAALGQGTGGTGLLAEVAAQARRTGTSSAARDLAGDLAVYRARHAMIAALATGPRFLDAVDLAVRSAAAGASPADRVSANLGSQIQAAQRRFAGSAGDATAALAGLAPAIPVLVVFAAALALVGLSQRIREYR
jgi:hypothetical protein